MTRLYYGVPPLRYGHHVAAKLCDVVTSRTGLRAFATLAVPDDDGAVGRSRRDVLRELCTAPKKALGAEWDKARCPAATG